MAVLRLGLAPRVPALRPHGCRVLQQHLSLAQYPLVLRPNPNPHPTPGLLPPPSPQALLSPNATVLRDGQAAVLPAESLVPGDVVLLKSGDKVGRRRWREGGAGGSHVCGQLLLRMLNATALNLVFKGCLCPLLPTTTMTGARGCTAAVSGEPAGAVGGVEGWWWWVRVHGEVGSMGSRRHCRRCSWQSL